MTATTSIRAASCRRVIDLLRSDPDNAAVTVGYGVPLEQGIGDGSIWVQVADDEGTVEVANMKAGRYQRRDTWQLEFWILVHCSDDENGLETAERVTQIYSTVENLLATNPTLALDGSGLPGLVSCVQSGETSGPTTSQTDSGFAGWVHCFADCEARLL